MDTLTWVVAANAAVWLGLGAYLAFMGVAQRLSVLAPAADLSGDLLCGHADRLPDAALS